MYENLTSGCLGELHPNCVGYIKALADTLVDGLHYMCEIDRSGKLYNQLLKQAVSIPCPFYCMHGWFDSDEHRYYIVNLLYM